MPGCTYIYLIEAEIGRVKIGSGRSPEERLKAVAGYSPVKTRLIAKWPGTMTEEFALHAQFYEQRSHNEWFLLEGSLLAFVEARRGLGIEHIHEWHEITFTTKAERKAARALKQSELMKAVWSQPDHRANRARWAAERQVVA